MPSQRNIHSLASVKHDIKDAKAVIFTDYAGLTVSDQGSLRAKLVAVGGKLMVVKNNLLKLALKETALPKEVEDVLHGPTALIVANDDAVVTTKALTDFIKDKEKPSIKIGLMGGKVLTQTDIQTLSKLPSRNQLLSNLLAQLQAPMQALVRQVNAPAQRLVYALEAIKSR